MSLVVVGGGGGRTSQGYPRIKPREAWWTQSLIRERKVSKCGVLKPYVKVLREKRVTCICVQGDI